MSAGVDIAPDRSRGSTEGAGRATELSAPRPGLRYVRDIAPVAAPGLLALLLCCVQITSRSLGFDEGATVAIASQHGHALSAAIAHDGGNMSGYYVLMHVLFGAFGSSVVVLRLPSALAIAAATVVLAVLARRVFGPRAAFASGLLGAVSLPLIFWGQSARGYALMVALVAGSFLGFVALVEGDGERKWPAWLAYSLTTTLAIYMGFVAALIVPAQLAMVAARRRAWPRVVSAMLATALCCIPLVVMALHRGTGQLFWVPRPNLRGEKQVLEALTSAGLAPNFHTTSTTAALTVLTLIVVMGAAVAILLRGRSAWGPALALAWAIVPVLLAFVLSLVGQPMFLPRNLLVSVPAVALLLAWALTHQRVPRALGWSLLAALIVLRALQVAPSYGTSPEDWRGASAYVLGRTQHSDCVAFYPSDGRMAFDYYVRADGRAARAPLPILPTAPWREVVPYVEDYAGLSAAQVRRLPSACPRLWLVSSHQGQPDGPAAARANLRRYLALRQALTAAYAHRASRSFGYASAVRVDLLAR